jgi:acyl carrier protein
MEDIAEAATQSQGNECEDALNLDRLIFHSVAQLMPNTLGLDDDLEPVEVVRHLERIFDIRVSNEEAESIFNVGEFYDLLLDKIPSNDADRKCASAMTFYRIRRPRRGDGR